MRGRHGIGVQRLGLRYFCARNRPGYGTTEHHAYRRGAKGLELATVELDVLGDTANEVGTYHMLAEGGVTADRGKYVVVWKKEDGEWRLHRDIIATSVPSS